MPLQEINVSTYLNGVNQLKPENLKELRALYNAKHLEFLSMVRELNCCMSIYTINSDLLKTDVTATSL